MSSPARTDFLAAVEAQRADLEERVSDEANVDRRTDHARAVAVYEAAEKMSHDLVMRLLESARLTAQLDCDQPQKASLRMATGPSGENPERKRT